MLPVGERDEFYGAVWTAGEPAQVPLGLPARAYKSWFAGDEADDMDALDHDDSGLAEGVQNLEALVDIPAAQGDPCGGSDSDVLEVCVTLCAGPISAAGPSADMPQASVARPPAAAPREGESPEGGGDRRSSGQRSTSSESRGSAEPVVASAARPEHFVSYRAVLPDRVEGQALTEQMWEGDRPFHRLRVLCPLHRGCGKARNFGPMQTAAHGPLEVAGYLGDWLMQAGSFETKRDHQRHRPTAGDVTTYLAAQTWAAGARARRRESGWYDIGWQAVPLGVRLESVHCARATARIPGRGFDSRTAGRRRAAQRVLGASAGQRLGMDRRGSGGFVAPRGPCSIRRRSRLLRRGAMR